MSGQGNNRRPTLSHAPTRMRKTGRMVADERKRKHGVQRPQCDIDETSRTLAFNRDL